MHVFGEQTAEQGWGSGHFAAIHSSGFGHREVLPPRLKVPGFLEIIS